MIPHDTGNLRRFLEMVDPILTYLWLSICFNAKSGSRDLDDLGGPPWLRTTPRPAWDCRRSMDWCRWQLEIAAMIPEPAQRSHPANSWKKETAEVCHTFCWDVVSHFHSFRFAVVRQHRQLPNLQSWSFRILQDDYLWPALPVALWEPSHKWHTHTWGHQGPTSTNSEPLTARLQTFRSNHAVAPLSLPCIPWIPGEKTVFLTGKRGKWGGNCLIKCRWRCDKCKRGHSDDCWWLCTFSMFIPIYFLIGPTVIFWL